jgi:hypothetical protein
MLNSKKHACPSGKTPAGALHLVVVFFSLCVKSLLFWFILILHSLLIAFLVYVTCITTYNRFFLGLRGWDQFPSIPWLSPMRLFSYLYDKITGRGDGIVGGPGLGFNSSRNGPAASGSGRWGFRNGDGNTGASRWKWGRWGRRSNSNGYGRIPEEEEGILGDDRRSFDDEGDETTPRGANGNGIGFDNAWAGARSPDNGLGSDGIIRL